MWVATGASLNSERGHNVTTGPLLLCHEAASGECGPPVLAGRSRYGGFRYRWSKTSEAGVAALLRSLSCCGSVKKLARVRQRRSRRADPGRQGRAVAGTAAVISTKRRRRHGSRSGRPGRAYSKHGCRRGAITRVGPPRLEQHFQRRTDLRGQGCGTQRRVGDSAACDPSVARQVGQQAIQI